MKDLFTEKKGGKVSSKKFWGNIFLALCAATYILDGFHFYDVGKELFNSILVAGCTLVGLRTVGGIFNNEDK